jgi:hypothetical protein
MLRRVDTPGEPLTAVTGEPKPLLGSGRAGARSIAVPSPAERNIHGLGKNGFL